MRRHPVSAALAAAMLLTIGFPAGAADPGTSPEPGATAEVTAPSVPVTAEPFGGYTLVPLLGDTPPYAGPATPRTLVGVSIAPEIEDLLSDPAVGRALRQRGFVVIPSDFARFHMAYEGNTYEGWPVFVTTDAAYNAWHQVFDKILRSVEQELLLPRLETLLGRMLANARAQAGELAGTEMADEADRLVQLLQVAGVELGIDVGTLAQLAKKERRLIRAHDRLAHSPILGTMIDYSLFTPRGHYTRNEDLTRYFLGMSVLGQSAFCLPGTVQNGEPCPGADSLRLAQLAARTFVGDAELEGLWRQIYEPTAFLVGVADDYTPFDLAAAVESAVPGATEDPTLLATDEAIESVSTALKAARPVAIDPEGASVRLMGARFVVDSWVLDQLIYPNVGTSDDPRLMPSVLDLAAAFGSEFAYRQQDEAGETAYPGYDEQLAAMRTALAERPDEAWGSTVYDAWLAAIEPMFLPHGAAFPDFMRTKAWTAKSHQSGFGSYAELKHDTILYAKQFVGELGIIEPPPSPRNWVEPDPVPFARLGEMADLMRTGLAARGVLTDDQRLLLMDFRKLTDVLARVAADELAGTPIGKKDNERLRDIGGTLESIWWRSGDPPKNGFAGELTADDIAALVADIGRGGDEVLEIATGWIDRILVLVPDDEGGFQVAAGGVYSFYEFRQPASDRLTDEAWRSLLKEGDVPARPAWQDRFLP